SVAGNGVTHAVSRAGTAMLARKIVFFVRAAAFENVPLAFVVALPAALPLAKNVTFAPGTPFSASSSFPARSTEFVTLTRFRPPTVVVFRTVRTFAVRDAFTGRFTIDCASSVPSAFGVAPLTVHGVITLRQRYGPPLDGFVKTPAATDSFAPMIFTPNGARDV